MNLILLRTTLVVSLVVLSGSFGPGNDIAACDQTPSHP